VLPGAFHSGARLTAAILSPLALLTSTAVPLNLHAAAAPKAQPHISGFASRAEAAVARDLMLTWRQLGLGAAPEAAGEQYNFKPDR
jgi:hypothetical protein